MLLRTGLVVRLTIALLCVGPTALAQDATDAPPSAPVYAPDTRALDRIRGALDQPRVLALPDDPLRFYLEVVSRPRTWQEYMAGARDPFAITPSTPPSDRPGGAVLGGGAGIDLLAIFKRANQARREREARQIREQIDRELRAFDEAR